MTKADCKACAGLLGTGAGRPMMMSSAVTELARAGYAAAILWVLDANDRARRFYAPAGWKEDGASPSRTCPTKPIPPT